MVTRCITALNELDRVSEKISQKHSQKRFQSNAEARLKLAKKKIDQAFQECDITRDGVHTEWIAAKTKGFSSCPSPPKHKRNDKPKGTARSSKSAAASPDRGQHVESRRTQSWTNCRVENPPARCVPGYFINETVASPVSIYGRDTEAESQYRPTAWFNFTEQTSMGTIDSFACDNNNVKALCYKVDKTQAKGMPKLLRHRMEVRVGQNGFVRKASEVGMVVTEGVTDKSTERQGNTLTVKCNKERIAPLSWDEQMNWDNVKCISQKLSSPKDQQEKSLCETRPVIFHPRERAEELSDEVKGTSTLPSGRSPAFRMYLETRTLSADRRNLVASQPETLFTTIGVEDAREDTGRIPLKCDRKIQSAIKLEKTSGEDKVDSFHAPHGTLREGSKDVVIKYISEKFSKKVSFDDEEKEVRMETKQEEKEVRMETKQDFESDKDIVAPSKTTSSCRMRPRTSRERLLTTGDFGELPSQPPRPYTAPPSSPRLRRRAEEDAEEVWDELLINHYAPVRIPNSRLDSIDTENTEEAIDDENKHFCEEKESETPEVREDRCKTENSSEKLTRDSKRPSKLRVTFAPMSAPPRQVLQREDVKNRSKSATCHRQKAYSPPSPVVMLSQSSLELPGGLPPADALLNLRKKIREDLEQQNRDLQLDIQQLHLMRHSGDA